MTILITLKQSYYNSFTYQEHIQLTITFMIILIITTKEIVGNFTAKQRKPKTVTPTNSYAQKNFRAKIIRRRNFQSILLNNNTLIIINNTNEKNFCYFPIEYRSRNIIYCYKTLKIVVCHVTFCFFDNLDVTTLKSSRKPHVAGCARIWFNFPVNKKTKHK